MEEQQRPHWGRLRQQASRTGLLARIIASLVLVLLAVALWVAGGKIPPASPEWIAGVGSGLIVLGFAGIWVSFFAERQATKELSSDMRGLFCQLSSGCGKTIREIDERFSILAACRNAQLHDAYYDAEADDIRALGKLRNRILSEIRRATGTVRILGVSARGYLKEGDGFAAVPLKHLLEDQDRRRVAVQALLLHPTCEQAVYRALQEDQRSDMAHFNHSQLWDDITSSARYLVNWAEKEQLAIEGRFYKMAPQCFLLIINDVIFWEQYHLGTGGRASGTVPVFEVSKESPLGRQFLGHFDAVWRSAAEWPVKASQLDALEGSCQDSVKGFDYCQAVRAPGDTETSRTSEGPRLKHTGTGSSEEGPCS